MEEKDAVIQELPVFLSKALAENLYIFQYPMKPATSDFSKTHVMNSIIKPKSQEVKMEIGIDVYSDKYSSSKGEEIALNTEHAQQGSSHANNAAFFKSGTMDKISYKSTLPLSDSSKYVVAVVKDNEIHCTPLKTILQMRPSQSYLEKVEKRQKDAKNDNSSSEEEEAEQITVKFAKQESDMARKVRETTYAFQKQKNALEPWYDCVWWKSDSDCADLERMKLYSNSTDSGSALSLPKKNYLRKLVPPQPADEDESACIGAQLVKPRDMRSIHGLTLSDQCREILREAKLLSIDKIQELVQSPDENAPLTDTTLIHALNVGACFVRGLWTVKSSDFFTRASENSGVPANVMAAARDYVIYLFTKSDYVDRRKITAALKLPPAEILDILTSIASLNPRTGWELLQPPDTNFETKYPEIVQRQAVFWEAKQRQFNDMLNSEIIPKRQRKKSQKESFSPDTLLSPKMRTNSTSSSHDDQDSDGRKRLKNKSSTGLGKRSRNVSECVT